MIQIEDCKRGDRKALEQLYRQYAGKLLSVCRHYIKDESAAEDVLHDAFIIIFTSIKDLKNTSKIEGWMIPLQEIYALDTCEVLVKRRYH